MKQGSGSIAQAGTSTPDSTLILLQLADDAARDQLLMQELRSEGAAPKESRLLVLSADPTPVFAAVADSQQEPQAQESITSGDPEGHARLFAMYTGQLHARIERLWRRPRSPVRESRSGAGTLDEVFRCQASIRQDARGRILEILLPECNGTPDWQRSLVLAISEAAPLPPPSNPSVFSETLTMNFVGLPYAPDASPDEYEIPPREDLSAHR